ncbi:NAC domain-containing protein 78-like [Solanum pennellii]|uniref:NAC domain-containing protein 78-like n=1 Tax=Solanum pennellii TaxID=28526 RepID=A0ABM1GLA2_SOLPN|nr:NAC domain-containing protein 78-like [Solanum pennellii]
MENLQEGFRFSPTDEEALTFLLRFIAGKLMEDSGFITFHVDTYGEQEPWDIYNQGVSCCNDDDCSQYRFFITNLKKKSKSRYSRNVGNKGGSWKQEDKSKPIRKSDGAVIGSKKSMCYKKKGYKQEHGHWLMKEYDLSPHILDKFDKDCRDFVLCAIKKKKSSSKGKLNIVGEQDQSSCEGLQVDAGELELQNIDMHEGTSNLVEPLSAPVFDFDYQYSSVDFDCLRSITA